MLAVLIVSPGLARAQVSIGQNIELRSGGDLSFGYSGSHGTQEASSHALDLGGQGWLRGHYYKPQFVSFEFQPYYRRSQNTSIFQTVTNGSGFTSSASIFGGSRFPGSVSYARTSDNTGQFGIPGIAGITSRGSGDNFSVAWSALIPDLPTLTATYSVSSGDSTIFGANAESHSGTRNLTLQSTYRVAGFDLLGQYFRFAANSTFPTFFTEEGTQESRNHSNAFLFTVGHKLFQTGHWNLIWTRTHYTGTYRNGNAGGSNDGVVNTLNSTVSLNPTRKLGLMAGSTYNDNAFGTFQQRILESGGVLVPGLSTSLRTLSVNGQASYSVLPRLTVYVRASRYEQWLRGNRRGLTQLSGNASYSYTKPFLGSLTFSMGVVDTFTQKGNGGATLVGNVNYMRRIRSWELGADFSYLQQIQTLFDVYTTSTYRYGAGVKKRFNGVQWYTTFNGSHSGLTQFSGYSSRNEGFSSGLIFSRYSINGHYTQSEGTSILTPGGLIEVPPGVPPPLLQLPVLYNARSFGGGATVRLFRRASLSAGYNKARSSTLSSTLTSGFSSTIFNSRFQVRLRKLNVEANYTKFEQNIVTGAFPAVVNSYYIRLSRWFNIF